MDKIENIVDQYFRTITDKKKQLELLSLSSMAEAVDQVVNKERGDAIRNKVQ